MPLYQHELRRAAPGAAGRGVFGGVRGSILTFKAELEEGQSHTMSLPKSDSDIHPSVGVRENMWSLRNDVCGQKIIITSTSTSPTSAGLSSSTHTSLSSGAGSALNSGNCSDSRSRLRSHSRHLVILSNFVGHCVTGIHDRLEASLYKVTGATGISGSIDAGHLCSGGKEDK